MLGYFNQALNNLTQEIMIDLCQPVKNSQTTVELLGTDTSLLRTVSYVLTKFSYISSKKTLYNTDPL